VHTTQLIPRKKRSLKKGSPLGPRSGFIHGTKKKSYVCFFAEAFSWENKSKKVFSIF
jgi:hypothetical protein